MISASPWRLSRAGASAPCRRRRCRLWASGAPAGSSNSSDAAAAKAPVSMWRLVMRRVVSLFLPTWSTDRVRRQLGGAAAPPADAPLVLAGRQGRRRVVLAADEAAQRAGLHAGMTITKAQILVQDLIIRNADPPADAAALDRLALWMLRYAPIAASDPPDGLVIDATGAAHLHGGEEALLNDMVERLVASGCTARAAMAESWDAAHAFARHAGKSFTNNSVIVVPQGESAKAVLDL